MGLDQKCLDLAEHFASDLKFSSSLERSRFIRNLAEAFQFSADGAYEIETKKLQRSSK